MTSSSSGTEAIPYWVAILGAVSSSALGALVMLGWFTHNASIIQVLPDLVPMQFNTALGFLASGLGLFCVARGIARIGVAAGVVVAVMGILTLVEYVFMVDIGIDQILMDHYVTVQTSYRGRMAPNTALCFLLLGIAFIAFETPSKMSRLAIVEAFLGSLVLGLGLVALAGYVVSGDAIYGWGQWTRMAVHTTAGFSTLGIATISLAWHRSASPNSGLPPWLPGAVGFVSLSLSIGIWRAFEMQDALLIRIFETYDPHSFINETLLGSGIALSVALAAVVYLAQAARGRELALASVNRKLESEISQRGRVRRILRLGETERDELRHQAGERVKELNCMYGVVESICRTGPIDALFKEVVTLVPPGWHYPEITRCRIRFDGREYVSQPFDETPWKQSAEIISQGSPRGTLEVFFLEGSPALDEGPFLSEERNLIESLARALGAAVERDESARGQIQLEEQLVRSQKMESIGRLAGGVAHDFNNLLTVILSSCSFMAEDLREGDPLLEDLRQIEEAGERAAVLTRQLLAFGRRQILQTRVLDLIDVLREMDRMLRRLIGEDVEISTVLDPELSLIVADPGQMEQVVMNLVVNARDAMPNGGRLTIEARNAELDEAYESRHGGVAPGSYVMLAVSDTGSGMDSDTESQIFDPFFTTKEKGKGTGLGLSTVYGIVKQHGGNIWVYSEPGVGSTFKVYLPKAENAEKDVLGDAKEVLDSRGSETVLVVEDETAVLRLAVRILERRGYRVLQARDGLDGEAVANVYAGSIQLLLTDVVMPRVGGRDLADKLLRERPEMKVLFMSGYTDNSIIHQGVLDQRTHFLQKPFSVRSLAEKVREVLDGD